MGNLRSIFRLLLSLCTLSAGCQIPWMPLNHVPGLKKPGGSSQGEEQAGDCICVH